MAVTNEQLPLKSHAAPLHGDSTKKVMFALNVAFALIGFQMLAGLAPKIGAKLALSRINQPAAPSATQATPGARGPTIPGLNAPKPPTFNN